MSTPRSCRYPPTPRLSERKRALFPSPLCKYSPQSILSDISNTPRRSNRLAKHLTPVQESLENITPSSRGTVHTPLYLSGDSSDLGHMSPLELSSSPVRYDSPFHTSLEIDSPSALLARPRFFNKKQIEFNDTTTGSSNIDDDTDVHMKIVDPETPRKDFSGIFVKKVDAKDNILLSTRNRYQSNLDIESLLDADTIIPETPEKVSPYCQLRTPREVCPENSRPPKLHSRKSISEIECASPTAKSNLFLKRRLSKDCFENVNNKISKVDDIPKARASLFPEAKSLFSAKSFYSKTAGSSISGIISRATLYDSMSSTAKNNSAIARGGVTKITTPTVCKRTSRKHGEINLGVKHNIRRPRTRRSVLSKKEILLNTAMEIIDNSPLNDYLVSNLQNDSTIMGANKRNSTTPVKSQEFDGKLPSADSKVIEPPKEFSISLDFIENESLKENNPNEPMPGRKFFKNRRSLLNKKVKIQDNIVLNIRPKSNVIPKPSGNVANNDSTNNNTLPDIFKDTEADLTKEQREVEKLLSEWHESDESLVENVPENTYTEPSVEIHMKMEELEQEIALIDSKIAALSSSNISSVENDIHGSLLPNVLIVQPGNVSPTSQLSSMTSFMALDSPVLGSTGSTQGDSSQTSDENSDEKLYPIFYKDNTISAVDEKSITKPRQRKLWTPNGAQYQIDAGQKRFGATLCQECNLLYQIADPEEEIFHLNYHNSMRILNFKGWSNECVISVLAGIGRIIHIKFNAPKSWQKRVGDILQIMDNELGVLSTPYEPSEAVQAYLMVNSKQVIGLLVATKLEKANRMISSSDNIDLCTIEEFDVKCGVSRIWIAPPFRGRGIAIAMLNAMRCNFMFGRVLDLDEIAFSTPTPDGISLAKRFTKRDDFLVYSGF